MLVVLRIVIHIFFYFLFIVLYSNLINFVFTILTFNIKYIGSEPSYIFFISKGLVQSHDSSREFSRLTQVNSGFFLLIFLIDFF